MRYWPESIADILMLGLRENVSVYKQLMLGLIRVAALDTTLACSFAANAQSSNPEKTDRGGAGQGNLQIAAGTILPVRLNHGFSSKKTHVGQFIMGRIMQDVPLPNSEKIPEGARVLGTTLSVTPAGRGGGGQISLRFDEIEVHHRKAAIVTDLRAIASFMEVQYAQIPETAPGFGTPYTWVTTDLIGGDVKYGVGGPVTDSASQVVGQGTFSGVLARARARSASHCRGELNSEDRLQALWVFSGDACGVYGLNGLKIVHAGRSAPVGEIFLAVDGGEVNVRAGSGMLLRVVP